MFGLTKGPLRDFLSSANARSDDTDQLICVLRWGFLR